MFQDCSSVHGMFLLSPVDGVDPFGLIDSTCISPPSKLNFHTPALVISGGLDSVPGVDLMGGLFPACAPEVVDLNVKLQHLNPCSQCQDLSNERFYSALTGPTVLVNTTEYGHLDCLDEAVFQLAASIHLCAANKELDREVYRNYIAGDTSVVEHFSS